MEKLNIKDGISAVYGNFKNAGMVPHFHECYSIGLFTAGEYRYKSGSKEAILKAGETRVISPYQLHQTYEGEWQYLHFDIEAKLLLDLVKDIEQNDNEKEVQILPLHKEKILFSSAKDLYRSLQNREQLEIEYNFNRFATTLLHSSNSLNLICNITLERKKLGRALDYIFTYWNKPTLSVGEIAKEVSFSTYYFTRSFTKEFLITPHKFIQSIRVERAKQLILKTSMPLAQISQECGFSDQSHMIRVFKRISGYTPNTLRE